MTAAKPKKRAKPARLEVLEPYCIACGCSEFAPCETASGPCGWTVPGRAGGRGMCSACAPHFKAPEATVRRVCAILEARP